MSFIYFLQADVENGPIKIGFTTRDPMKRKGDLQVGCPWPIKVIGVIEGTHSQEQQIHFVLDCWRTRGEWFTPHPIVCAAVNEALACGRRVAIPSIEEDSSVAEPEIIVSRRLSPAAEIIDRLGGIKAVSRLTGAKPKAISNWRMIGKFPWRTRYAITEALAAHGQVAPDAVWGLKWGRA